MKTFAIAIDAYGALAIVKAIDEASALTLFHQDEDIIDLKKWLQLDEDCIYLISEIEDNKVFRNFRTFGPIG